MRYCYRGAASQETGNLVSLTRGLLDLWERSGNRGTQLWPGVGIQAKGGDTGKEGTLAS